MKEHNMNKLTAVRHNMLNEASYTMSLNEKRLVYSALSQIDPRGQSFPDEIKVFAQDFADQWGISRDSAYTKLKSAREELRKREIRTVNLKNGEVWDINWIDSSAYQDGNGYVILCFSQKIRPYLVNLHEKFTSIRLFEIKKFSSTHTIRIFESLIQYINKNKSDREIRRGWFKVEVSDLRTMLELGNKYEKWADLKRYVINKAISEINNKSNYIVTLPKENIVKKGRVVHSIKLEIEYNKQPDFFKQD